MAQLTSFRSIPAAAEGLVTFRFRFSWWKARLLVCLGSSAAQGDAGGPGAPPLRRKTAPKRWFGQARRSCGIAWALNFCKPRAQWPGRNRRKPLKFCAPEIFCLTQGVTPVMGVQGVGGMEAGAATPFLPIAPTPWRLFGSFLPVQKGTRRRGGETPPANK